MDSIADTLTAAAVASDADLSDPWACLALLAEHGTVPELFDLPEARELSALYTRPGGHRHEVTINHARLLHRWLEGAEITVLADEFLAAVPALDWRYEQLGDYLTARFEHHLAWFINTLVEWVNTRLSATDTEHVTLCPELGGYVRHGTADPISLALLQEGVRTRRLANAVARHARAAGHETVDAARDWLRTLGPSRWAELFQASATDLQDLLEIASDRSVRLLGPLLDGQDVEIPVVPATSSTRAGPATIETDDDTVVGPIHVSVAGRRVAEVATRHHADLRIVRETRLPLTGSLRQVDGSWSLVVALAED